MSGYKIVESCNVWFSHFWGESYGQIYPTLKKLLANGDVEKLPRKMAKEVTFTKSPPKVRRHLKTGCKPPRRCPLCATSIT
jgi:hypothetical protein